MCDPDRANLFEIGGVSYRPIDQCQKLVGNKLVHVNGSRFPSGSQVPLGHERLLPVNRCWVLLCIFGFAGGRPPRVMPVWPVVQSAACRQTMLGLVNQHHPHRNSLNDMISPELQASLRMWLSELRWDYVILNLNTVSNRTAVWTRFKSFCPYLDRSILGRRYLTRSEQRALIIVFVEHAELPTPISMAWFCFRMASRGGRLSARGTFYWLGSAQ